MSRNVGVIYSSTDNLKQQQGPWQRKESFTDEENHHISIQVHVSVHRSVRMVWRLGLPWLYMVGVPHVYAQILKKPSSSLGLATSKMLSRLPEFNPF